MFPLSLTNPLWLVACQIWGMNQIIELSIPHTARDH